MSIPIGLTPCPLSAMMAHSTVTVTAETGSEVSRRRGAFGPPPP